MFARDPTPFTLHELEHITAIYVVGPSSVGKTTLCNALAKQLGISSEAYITEVARTVMQEQGFTRADVDKPEMQQAIVDVHVARDKAARSAALRLASRTVTCQGERCPGCCAVVLSDRSAVDAVVYARLSSTAAGSALAASRSFQVALDAYRAQRTVIVLLQPIAEWLVDDGVRSLDDGTRCFDMFKTVLRELNIPYVELGSECRYLEDRVGFVRRLSWV